MSKLAYWDIFFGGEKIYKSWIWTLSTQWGCNLTCFLSTGCGFRDTGWFSKLPYLGIKPRIWKSSRSCIWTLFLFLHKGVEIELIFALRFWDTDWFSKLPYLGMKPGIWKKFLMDPLSTPEGRKLSLFSLYRQRFPRYRLFLKITIQGMIPGIWKRARSYIWTLFLPQGAKLSLFSLYGQRFLRHGLILKITIFGHETWNLKKCQKLHIDPLSTTGVEIELIFALRAAVSDIRAYFENYQLN